MIIFVVVGMPASGKNIARGYAWKNGYPYISTGDIVREEVQRRSLVPDAENTAYVSDELRGPDGMGVTRAALEKALEKGASVMFLEGMRSWPEIELVASRARVVVVAFVAPRDTRRRRMAQRGRQDDSPEAFDLRDAREIAYGAAVPIALADEYVLNTLGVEDAEKALDMIVKRHVS